MNNVDKTIISQYANSPTLLQLINDMNEAIDPSVDIDNFFNYVFNIETAQGFGLDIWGKIVGVGRTLVVQSGTYFGFKNTGNESFGFGTFFTNYQTSNFVLNDDVYRQLILTKAMANIMDCSIPAYNALLLILFAGRGQCFVEDLGSMQMQFTFKFGLQNYEIAIFRQSGAIPIPSGVKAQLSINGVITSIN